MQDERGNTHLRGGNYVFPPGARDDMRLIKRALFFTATMVAFASFMVVVFGDNDPNQPFRALMALSLFFNAGAWLYSGRSRRTFLVCATASGIGCVIAAVFSAHDANQAFRITLALTLFATFGARLFPREQKAVQA